MQPFVNKYVMIYSASPTYGKIDAIVVPVLFSCPFSLDSVSLTGGNLLHSDNLLFNLGFPI